MINMDHQKNVVSFNNEYTCYEGWETFIRFSKEDEERNAELRKGPWTPQEDSKLTSSIVIHGEGRWNALARLAGLRRSGKSCRLRWLNYLRPDLRRGPFTLQEQLLVFQLYFRWGNRWSKIAENLPGRTDNEIKNYWRTKVQKLAKQFQCDVNSPEFKDALRHFWIPRLAEQIQAASTSTSTATSYTTNAQIQGPPYDYGLGPNGSAQTQGPSHESNGSCYSTSSASTSPVDCCLLDSILSWDQTFLDQCVVGPDNLCSKPSSMTDLFEAHISPESGSSADFDLDWEQLNDLLWEIDTN